jgi:hypothetical protein
MSSFMGPMSGTPLENQNRPSRSGQKHCDQRGGDQHLALDFMGFLDNQTRSGSRLAWVQDIAAFSEGFH